MKACKICGNMLLNSGLYCLACEVTRNKAKKARAREARRARAAALQSCGLVKTRYGGWE